MAKIQISGFIKAEVLFVVIFSLLSGCATPPKQQPKKRILEDVLVFRDLQQVDLDNDGTKEIVAIYATSNNSTGVKVIKLFDDNGNVVFERIFSTPDVKFWMKNKVGLLSVDSKSEPYGRKIRSVYRWDSKASSFVGK